MTLNDGRALVVAFLIEPDAAHGRFKYQTSIYLASLDRPPIKGEHHTYDDVVISTERPDVRIGESWLRGNLDTYGLVVDPGSHGGLGLDATIERVVPSRVSPASTDIVVGGERGLGWVNPIPSGTLAGSPQCKRSSPPIG